jgi:type II secretion system protein G
MLRIHTKESAFTLIELLVVVSIISLLSSVILSSLGESRQKAFVARAQADIQTIQSALELHYLDRFAYPELGGYAMVSTADDYQWYVFEFFTQPYLTAMPKPPYPSEAVEGTGGMSDYIYGYVYYNPPSDQAVRFQVWNRATEQFSSCVTVGEGYYLAATFPFQNSNTLNDGGVDPNAIEIKNGDVTFSSNIANCPEPIEVFNL